LREVKKLKSVLRWWKGKASGANGVHRGALQIHDLVVTGATFSDDSGTLVESFNEQNQSHSVFEVGEFYPKFYDTNPKTLSLLEHLISKLKPQIIVETGIANGSSTRKILGALAQRGTPGARLYSCDVDERVATTELKENERFEFIHINSRADFSNLVNRLDKIDLFYHDSDHSYNHQMFEYLTVWDKLSKGGVLMSDDINWSYAFLDFCKIVGRVPWVLSDTQKFSGFIQK
jgi:predicted O-methyltransferase YrrM